ncbi:hypothetical protein TrCOL_g13211 [Triparma columacea]|uniref:DUF7802 domain-containing protein n=1 Tax=Triparma columacea TaxID=722753 RepID=A0A9W7GMS6_9STRA|nr:hypothetical protein TrCOL_g13211 [Triparma columacea]
MAQPSQPSYPHVRFGEDLAQALSDHPTIAIAELLFISLSLLCLLHAFTTSRSHIVVWVSAITSGTMNDLFFMYLPFSDNFWHAQATIMLSPRLPLYIPAAYSVFQYVGVATAFRLPSTYVAGRCAYAALVSCFFYALYDLVGARYLWWTWHSTDAAVFHRWAGVPIGSTMWTLIHVAVFTAIIQWSVVGRRKCGVVELVFRGVVWTGILCTPLMMAGMGPFQLHQLRFNWYPPAITQFPGRPDSIAISLVITLFSYVSRPALSVTRARATTSDYALFGGCFLFLVGLLAVTYVFDPSEVVSTGIHQTQGPCDEIGYDISGYERFTYFCSDKKKPQFSDRYFSLCKNSKKDLKHGVEWYTVCGKGGGRNHVVAGVLTCISAYLLMPLCVQRRWAGIWPYGWMKGGKNKVKNA